MFGLGTIINVTAIVAAGIVGKLFGKLLVERCQQTLSQACGICVLFLGIAGAMEGMLKVEGTSITSGGTMLIVASLALGALLGELLNLEDKIEHFGEWLKLKTGNGKDIEADLEFISEEIEKLVELSKQVNVGDS